MISDEQKTKGEETNSGKNEINMQDLQHSLILLNGEFKTAQIESINKMSSGAYSVRFKNNVKRYTYSTDKVVWLTNPQQLSPEFHRIYRNDIEQRNITEMLRFSYGNKAYWRITFQNGYQSEYADNQISIATSCLNDETAKNTLAYMRSVASINPLGKENGETGILTKLYQKLDFIDNKSAAACYFTPDRYSSKKLKHGALIYPFGCNASQKQAVTAAFENQISVIQGPPGTGKTQTILNIIANIIMNGKTVLVVSNNNSAIENIQEKLKKLGFSFILAALGKKENQEKFIKQQPDIPEKLNSWSLSLQDRTQLKADLQAILQQLNEVFSKQNNQAKLRQEQQAVELEWKHFCMDNGMDNDISKNITRKQKINSSRIISLWLQCQILTDGRTSAENSFFTKLACHIKQLWIQMLCHYYLGIQNKFDATNLSPLITELQTLYYLHRLDEIAVEIEQLQQTLSSYNGDELIKRLTEQSATLFKSALHEKYSQYNRKKFSDLKEMHSRGKDFTEQYPVVLSTTFSARTCQFHKPYDYIIMDEASQISVETGALALSCALNAVIVGDTLQLPNVVTDADKNRLKTIMQQYNIADSYDCAKNSFLQSILAVINGVAETRLLEHYRCHPCIINFCNQKFYAGELRIMTQDQGEKDVLCAFKTVKGNHAINNYNQREIDVVKQEVLPAMNSFKDIGIVTPYNHQVTAFLHQLPEIETATIHKYQGREKDAIIMSVVDNNITVFADDPHLLNVAVSRAKKKFCLVITGNEQKNGNNIMDLLGYINYHNCTITESKVASIFDYLYEQYTCQRISFLQNHPHISEYDSENLTHAMIDYILKSNKSFGCFRLLCHIPLRQIIRDFSLMSAEEQKYATNYNTHVDFLIVKRVSKKPVLAIETDGYSYHNNTTKQSQRDNMKDHIFQSYNIPLLRLSTKGSGETDKVTKILLSLI